MLAEWLAEIPSATVFSTGVGNAAQVLAAPSPFLSRLNTMPVLPAGNLWPAQIIAINNLEKSLAANKPRSLIQMATGSGKTYTAISAVYRLIKYAGARRILQTTGEPRGSGLES